MIILRDFPIILALFAFVFGALGLLANQNRNLRQHLPNLRRNSYLYLLSALLLTAGLAFKTQLSPKNNLDYELALLSQPQLESLQDLFGQKESAELNLNIEPEVNLTFTFITIALSSDPIAADVFINNKLRGQTPLELLIPRNQVINYRISAAPNPGMGLRYESFEGTFQESQDRQVSVWLNRIPQ